MPGGKRKACDVGGPAHHHHRKSASTDPTDKVDAADEDDEGHADRHDAEHGDLIEDVQTVSNRKKGCLC